MSVLDNVHVHEEDARVAERFFAPVKRLEQRLDAIEESAEKAFQSVEASKAFLDSSDALIGSVADNAASQIADVVEHFGKLDDDLKRLHGLAGDVEEAKGALEAVKEHITELNKTVARLDSVTKAHNGCLESNLANIRDIEDLQRNEMSKLDSLRREHSEVSTKLKELDDSHTIRLDEHSSKLNELIKDKDQFMQTVQTDLHNTSAECARLVEIHKSDSAAQLSAVKGSVSNAEASIDRLKSDQKEINEQTNRALDLHKGLQVAMRRMEGKLDSMQIDITNLQMQVGS